MRKVLSVALLLVTALFVCAKSDEASSSVLQNPTATLAAHENGSDSSVYSVKNLAVPAEDDAVEDDDEDEESLLQGGALLLADLVTMLPRLMHRQN